MAENNDERGWCKPAMRVEYGWERGKIDGTFACPICGIGKPHEHTSEEIVNATRDAVLLARKAEIRRSGLR